jgi:hypothetical protein
MSSATAYNQRDWIDSILSGQGLALDPQNFEQLKRFATSNGIKVEGQTQASLLEDLSNHLNEQCGGF